MAAIKPRVKGVVRLRIRMPLTVVISDLFQLPDGRLGTIGVICASRRHWRTRVESNDDTWIVIPWGPWVVAYRIDV